MIALQHTSLPLASTTSMPTAHDGNEVMDSGRCESPGWTPAKNVTNAGTAPAATNAARAGALLQRVNDFNRPHALFRTSCDACDSSGSRGGRQPTVQDEAAPRDRHCQAGKCCNGRIRRVCR